MPLNNDSERLDRIERLIEESNRITLLNSRIVQTMLEARATERLEHEERMRRWEETIRSLFAINEKMANFQGALTNMVGNTHEDPPVILRKVNNLKNFVHSCQEETQLIQSGSALKVSQGNLTINFPTSFSNIPIVVVSSYWINRSMSVSHIETIVSINNSGFVVSSDNAASDYYVNWIAIGNL